MIRRDVLAADGSPEWVLISRHDNVVISGDICHEWLLISQIDHARISGQICEFWSAVQTLPEDILSELIIAVTRHDDGWMEWEQAPEIDTKTGRPREFTEMPLAQSLEIWSQSIDKSTVLGDLAPYMISGHFCALMH